METQHIKKVQEGCLIGYKYFDLSRTQSVALTIKGKGKGTLAVRYGEEDRDVDIVLFENPNKGEFIITLPISKREEKSALYFYFKELKGKLDFYKLELK